MILCQTTQPVVLVTVDISLLEHEVKKQLLYWLSILTSFYADASKTLHIIVIGSHADQTKFKDRREIYHKVMLWVSSLPGLSLENHGFIQCDCRYSTSDNLTQLRQKLKSICKSLRLFLAHENDHSNRLCAALMYHLEHNKSGEATVTVSELHKFITEAMTPGSRLVPFADQHVLLETCKRLSSSGHLLFLPHDESIQDSVLILDHTF